MGSNSNDWFSERLPTDGDAQHVWQIVRTPSDRPLTFCIVSADWYGVRVHYWQNRTMPHLTSNCEPCNHKLLSRWKGYCLGVEQGTGKKLIFEFPAGVVSLFSDLYKSEGSLRGVVCVASRTSKKVNGRVHVTFKGFAKDRSRLPEEVEIKALLERIWGYAGNAGHVSSGPTFDDLDSDGGATILLGPSRPKPSRSDLGVEPLDAQEEFDDPLHVAEALGNTLRSPDVA